MKMLGTTALTYYNIIAVYEIEITYLVNTLVPIGLTVTPPTHTHTAHEKFYPLQKYKNFHLCCFYAHKVP